MFVLSYLGTMFVRTLTAPKPVDGVIGLAGALLAVLAGLSLVDQPTEGDLIVWIGWGALSGFAFEWLIVTPARHWRATKGPAASAAVTFEAGSITGGTVIVTTAPGQIPMFRFAPSLVDQPDDDPTDTDTSAGQSKSEAIS